MGSDAVRRTGGQHHLHISNRETTLYSRMVTLDGCAPIHVPCTPDTPDDEVLEVALRILRKRMGKGRIRR